MSQYFITAAEMKLGHASYIYDPGILRLGRQTAGGSVSDTEEGPRVPKMKHKESYARGHSINSSGTAPNCVRRLRKVRSGRPSYHRALIHELLEAESTFSDSR